MRFVHCRTVSLPAILAIHFTAQAQIICDQPGADAAIGAFPAPANFNSLNGIEAFSLGATICNVGSQPLNFFGSPSTQHPVMTQNLYRLSTVNGAARFEQIGMGWVFHTIFPINQSLCCGTCIPSDSTHLGVHCACPEPSTFMSVQSPLAPRWQVNAATAGFPVPPANPPFSGTIDRRLQAKITDIDPALNGGATYFGEMHLLALDDNLSGNALNNLSYRQCTFSGSGQAWNMALAGTFQGGYPAIHAWKVSDPAVLETPIDIPSDGRMILAAKATQISPGVWRYEYALFNLNSDRSAQSFTVPLPSGATITNIGFHDVDYHSGDGIGDVTTSGTDWTATQTANAITWSTETVDQNPNANALRWSTLYNFRFDADRSPAAEPGSITIETFKVAGSVQALTVVLEIPPCPADIAPVGGGDGTVNVDDLLLVIANWGGAGGPADITGDLNVNVDDLLTVINSWGPCP